MADVINLTGKLLERIADQDDEIQRLKENTPGIVTTELPPVFGMGTSEGGFESMDVEAFFNMRGWLQSACEAKGARMTGGGMGCGVADIDIELDGHHYNITIKPLPDR
jgi:hypothetical protein